MHKCKKGDEEWKKQKRRAETEEKAKGPPWGENEIFSNFGQDSTRIIIQHFFEILSQKLVAEYPGDTFSGNVSFVEVLQSAVQIQFPHINVKILRPLSSTGMTKAPE